MGPHLIKLLLSYHVVPSVVLSDMESALKPLFMTRVGSLFMTTSVPGAALTLTRVKPEGRDEHASGSPVTPAPLTFLGTPCGPATA